MDDHQDTILSDESDESDDGTSEIHIEKLNNLLNTEGNYYLVFEIGYDDIHFKVYDCEYYKEYHNYGKHIYKHDYSHYDMTLTIKKITNSLYINKVGFDNICNWNFIEDDDLLPFFKDKKKITLTGIKSVSILKSLESQFDIIEELTLDWFFDENNINYFCDNLSKFKKLKDLRISLKSCAFHKTGDLYIIPVLKILYKYQIENIYLSCKIHNDIFSELINNNNYNSIIIKSEDYTEFDISQHYKNISKNYNIQTLKIINSYLSSSGDYDFVNNVFDIVLNNTCIRNILKRNEKKISRVIEEYQNYDINLICFKKIT